MFTDIWDRIAQPHEINPCSHHKHKIKLHGWRIRVPTAWNIFVDVIHILTIWESVNTRTVTIDININGSFAPQNQDYRNN